MINKFKVFLLSIYFYLPTVLAEEVLYCVDEIGTGIGNVDGAWTTLGLKSEKRIIKFTDGYSKVFFNKKEFFCYEMVGDYINCIDEGGINLSYDPQTTRYAIAVNYSKSYLKDGDFEDRVAYLWNVGGTCESF